MKYKIPDSELKLQKRETGYQFGASKVVYEWEIFVRTPPLK